MNLLKHAPWLPTLLVGCFGSWLLCGPALFHPFTLQATALTSEGPGHLWGLWIATLDIPQYGGFVRTAEVGWPNFFASHLMDPINLLVFAPAYWLAGGGQPGASFAWNLLHAVAPLVGAASVWQLTKRLIGDHPSRPWAGMLAAITFVLSPYFVLYPQMGRTEYLPAVLYPLHVALLHRWLRRPSPLAPSTELEPKPPLWVGIGAGLSLGAAALGGWYLAVFMAFGDGLLGLFWSRGLGLREASRRLVLVAVLSLLVTTPAVVALLSFGIPVDLAGLKMEAVRCIPAAALFRMMDVETTARLDYEPYIGILPLVAAAFVAIRRPRTEAAWLLVALFCLSLGLGSRIAWNPLHPGSCRDGIPGPLGLITGLFPQLRAMRSWTRIMVLASTLGAGALAISTAVLWQRLRGFAIPAALGLGALMVADNTSFPAPMDWPPPTFDGRMPTHLLDALATLPPGPVITLPLDTRLRKLGLEEHGLWNLWQIEMKRPISAGALGASDPTQAHNGLTNAVSVREVEAINTHGGHADRMVMATNNPLPLPDLDEAEKLRDASVELMLAGYAGIVLAEDMEAGGDLRSLLISVLGQPGYDNDGVLAWNLHDLPLKNYLEEEGDTEATATPASDGLGKGSGAGTGAR